MKKKGRPKTGNRFKPVSIALTLEQHERINIAAEEKMTSVSAVVREAVAFFLAKMYAGERVPAKDNATV